MNIYFDCGLYNEKMQFAYQKSEKLFIRLLRDFEIHCLREIYVADNEHFDKTCWMLEEKLFGFSSNKQSSATIIGRCMEVKEAEYKQLLIIKCEVFLPIIVELSDSNFKTKMSIDRRTDLIIHQSFYHELFHLQEMEQRAKVGLTINCLVPNLLENSKKFWTEYYAERKSNEIFDIEERKTINLQKKFYDFMEERSKLSIDELLYNLTHFLAVKSEVSDEEVENELNKFIVLKKSTQNLLKYNVILKEMYKNFPVISKEDIQKIEIILEKIIYDLQ